VTGVADLVAVNAEGTDAFVAALGRCWAAGEAVLPVDPRLPAGARHRLLERLGATAEEAPDGSRRHLGGNPAAPGDALVVATSGTTGDPKGVVLTHEALGAAASAVHARLGVDPGGDRWLACLPLAHLGGLGVVVRSLISGVPFEVASRPDPDTVAGAARRGCTRVALVATAWARADTSGYQTVLLGGAAAPSGDLPGNVVVTYGLTETGGGVVYDGVPLDGVEVDERDGHLWVRSATLARAYRTPKGEVPLTGADGWFDTGDLGYLDADGQVVVEGRSDDAITTGGETVHPVAVETALGAHPGIAEVAVVGRPDDTWGEVVVAVVVPAHPDAPPDLGSLRDWVRQTLPAYAAPHHVEVVASLPRTALGKVARSELARRTT
jgi:O-succinylbenzoic acid--CoA ligase